MVPSKVDPQLFDTSEMFFFFLSPSWAVVSVLHPLLGVTCIGGVSFNPVSSTVRGEDGRGRSCTAEPHKCPRSAGPHALGAGDLSASQTSALPVGASSSGRPGHGLLCRKMPMLAGSRV